VDPIVYTAAYGLGHSILLADSLGVTSHDLRVEACLFHESGTYGHRVFVGDKQQLFNALSSYFASPGGYRRQKWRPTFGEFLRQITLPVETVDGRKQALYTAWNTLKHARNICAPAPVVHEVLDLALEEVAAALTEHNVNGGKDAGAIAQ